MWEPHHACCGSSPWLCTCCPQLSSSSSLPAQPWVPQLQGLRSKLLPVKGGSRCLEQPQTHRASTKSHGCSWPANGPSCLQCGIPSLGLPSPTPSPSDPSSLSSHLCFALVAALPHRLQGCDVCKPRGKAAAAVSPPGGASPTPVPPSLSRDTDTPLHMPGPGYPRSWHSPGALGAQGTPAGAG